MQIKPKKFNSTSLNVSLVFVVCLVLACPSGCQRDYVRPGQLVEVQGKVLLNDQPVSNARVVFVPEFVTLKSKFLISYGLTNAQGEFELETRDEQEGALPGVHRVIISRAHTNVDPKKSPLKNFTDGLDEENRQNEVDEVWSILKEATEQHDGEQIPFYYNLHSDLNCEVIPGIGIQKVRFDLTTLDPKLQTE